MGKISASLFAIPTWFVLVAFMLGEMSDCWDSATLKEELKSRLSPQEFSSIQSNTIMCPLSYSYIKDGKKRWAELIGKNIDFGDNENSP